jgi:hypothetical protein
VSLLIILSLLNGSRFLIKPDLEAELAQTNDGAGLCGSMPSASIKIDTEANAAET